MKKDRIYKILATLGPIGYFPASGTFGSLVPLLFIIFFKSYFLSLYYSFAILIILSLVSYYIINRALLYFYATDPSEIVLDEFVGMLFALFMIPINYKNIIAAFILFRFFDITKILGIKRIERRSGAWGILLDDIAAGMLANSLVNLLIYFNWL